MPVRPVCLVGFLIAMGCAAAAAPNHADPTTRAWQLFQAGVNQQRAGQSSHAIVLLTDAITSHALNRADAARAVFDRGLAYDSLGNSQAAITDYSEALRLDPSLSAARNNRGNAYRRTGQLENAKRDYLAALTIQGGARQYPLYGLGLIADQIGDMEGSRTYFMKALAAEPGFAPAMRSLAALNAKSVHKQVVKPPKSVAKMKLPVAEVHLRPAISDTGRPGVMVQLGAFRDENSAKVGWAKAVGMSGGVLSGLKPIIIAADLPGRGRFWRLRVVLPAQKLARDLCSRLVDQGQGCIPARN